MYEIYYAWLKYAQNYIQQDLPKFSHMMLFQCSHSARVINNSYNKRKWSSIRVFHFKVTVLLESINLKAISMFYIFSTDCRSSTYFQVSNIHLTCWYSNLAYYADMFVYLTEIA